jgi:hypothetical protein
VVYVREVKESSKGRLMRILHRSKRRMVVVVAVVAMLGALAVAPVRARREFV